MNAKMKNNAKLLGIAIVGVFIFTLVIVAFSYVFSYEDKLNANANEKAETALVASEEKIEDYIDESVEFVNEISVTASMLQDEYKFCDYLKDLCITVDKGEMTDEEYAQKLATSPKCIRYVKDGIFKDVATRLDYVSENSTVRSAAAEPDKVKFVTVANDVHYGMQLISIVAPIYANPYADAIVVYFPVDMLDYCEIESDNAAILFLAEVSTSAEDDGNIMEIFENDTSIFSEPELSSDLESVFDSDTDKASYLAMTKNSSAESITASISATDYSVCNIAVGDEALSGLMLVGFYRCDQLYASEYSFYQVLVILVVVFAVAMLVFIAIYIGKIIYNILKSKTELWDNKIGCYTYDGFLAKTGEITEQFKGSKFVFITAEIRFFKILLEKGSGAHVPYVKAVSSILKRMCNSKYEIYGYDTNGKFYIMLHFEDMKALEKWLSELDKSCAKQRVGGEQKLELIYGICELGEKRDVVTATANSHDALRQTRAQIGIRRMTVYHDDNDGEKLDREFIEMNAEKALKAGDFKIFFQPKYNVLKNTVDGAEALMRWFLPAENKFYPPFAFLPVIESNGFIVQVDHYVFEEVCKYIRQSLDSGERVYPVSVNVSRLTVAQENFTQYYADIKKKYRIRDGLLCIEFTESSDLQDYDFMQKILSELKAAGFIMSLDDFGTGFASYNCLKSLAVDEVKLDRFFIEGGLVEPREIAIVQSVINLGKTLGMKVTVEGVSDEEIYQKLKEYGCEVIQGYLYSKPIPKADYISFITSDYHGAFH